MFKVQAVRLPACSMFFFEHLYTPFYTIPLKFNLILIFYLMIGRRLGSGTIEFKGEIISLKKSKKIITQDINVKLINSYV